MPKTTHQFAHLHSHTDHSRLDGHASVKDLAQQAYENGQIGFSVTDHGVMSNTYNGWAAAKAIREKYDVPFYFIPGIEAYVTPGDTPRTLHEPVFFSNASRENKEERSNDVSGGGAYTHMTMFGETTEGMHNLFRLNTMAWHEGNYRKQRMDVESISQHSKGIIATTGCPSGELQTRLRLGQLDEALKYAGKMQDIFGKENYFLELMDHNMSINLERQVRGDLMLVAKKLQIPLLVTNDLHYVRKEDAPDHEHMLALQSGSSMSESSYDMGGSRFAFEGEEYYAKTTEQMLQLFPHEDYPFAVQNSAEIAMRSTANFEYDDELRPSVPLPEGHADEHSYLRELSYDGLARKRPDKINDPIYIERMESELKVLREKNLSGYILVVSDFMRWAKAQNILCGPGRGSGGGSLVCFSTDVTEIDPIPHGLIFERFINPERDSPPDVDSDFGSDNLEKVINYVRQKYGEETVARIITFGYLKAKSAIKDIVRIYEEPYAAGEELSKALPKAQAGKEISLTEVYDKNSKRYIEAEMFRETVLNLQKSGVVSKNLIPYAMGIEGKMRQTGVHAAGVIMSSRPLIETIPLMMRKKDGITITEFDYPTCEDIGLIKMDFLGLRNLNVIEKCVEAIERNHGIKIVPQQVYDDALDNPDQKTFDLINSGFTLGIFQLDNPDIAALARLIFVTEFNDICAILALYRPGPMGMNSHIAYADRKNGREAIVPIHAELDEVLNPILSETYQVICYQEQIQFIAQKVANYSLGRADILRRAMGKKKKSLLDAEFIPFSAGMKDNGYSDEAINALWETLIPFAEYGFNKSHSAGYGLVSYLTAYLKANYGPEFMAANLSTITDDKEKTASYLQECRRMGIKVKSPDISHSTPDYTATKDGDILVGLQAIRGVGYEVADSVHRETVANGAFSNLDDFLSRAPANALTKGALEGFAHAGALDSFGYSRRSLHTSLPEVAKGYAQVKKKQDTGQFTLFDMVEEAEAPKVNIVNTKEYIKKDKLMFERHALGLYVSDHPLSGIANMLERFCDTQAVDVLSGKETAAKSFGDRKTLRFAGVANSVLKRPTRAGGMMATFELEDISGSVPAIIFPKAYERLGPKLFADNIYQITGNLMEGDDGNVKLVVEAIDEIQLTESGLIPFEIFLGASQASNEAIGELQSLLRSNPGDMPVHLHVRRADGSRQVFELGDEYRVANSAEMVQEIQMLFGMRSISK